MTDDLVTLVSALNVLLNTFLVYRLRVLETHGTARDDEAVALLKGRRANDESLS